MLEHERRQGDVRHVDVGKRAAEDHARTVPPCRRGVKRAAPAGGRGPAGAGDAREGARFVSAPDHPGNWGRTVWAHRVMVMRSLRVRVCDAAVNSTRATTLLAPRRSDAVRRVSVKRPLRSAFVAVRTLWPRTKNVTRRIWRPETVAFTVRVVGQTRGPRSAAVPRAGRLDCVTPATCWAGAGAAAVVTGGVAVGVVVVVVVGVVGWVRVVVNVSSSVTTLPFWSVPLTSATLTTGVWPAAVCTWQV